VETTLGTGHRGSQYEPGQQSPRFVLWQRPNNHLAAISDRVTPASIRGTQAKKRTVLAMSARFTPARARPCGDPRKRTQIRMVSAEGAMRVLANVVGRRCRMRFIGVLYWVRCVADDSSALLGAADSDVTHSTAPIRQRRLDGTDSMAPIRWRHFKDPASICR
jgi:hypothetical protein